MNLKGVSLLLPWGFIFLQSFASSVEVRLADGSRTAGRVEVNVNGKWGTVCDDFWDLNDAIVVCRQLGFVGANEAIRYSGFGAGSGPIYFDDVDCIGNEVTLEHCNYKVLHNCFHSEDAGVSCKEQSYEEGDVRLVIQSVVTEFAGRVQIFTAESWDNLRVCVNTFDWKDVTVVCRQLGFYRVADVRFFRHNILPYADIKSTLNCSGDETRLDECPQKACTDVREVYVHCENALTTSRVTTAEKDGCPSLDKVRLVGNNSTAGRIEVCVNERWGTVCDDNWDMQDANVVCRELGFKGALVAPLRAHFGQGKGPVHVDDVGCLGNETSIFSCDYTDSTHCQHDEDAGVSCIPNRAGDLRLVAGNSTSGFVEVYIGDQWAKVCGRDWGLQEAAVACRQIGFKDAFSTSKKSPNRNLTMAVDELNCSGDEKSLIQCKHKQDSNCRYQEDAFVVCIAGEGSSEQGDPSKQEEKGTSSGCRLVSFFAFWLLLLPTNF